MWCLSCRSWALIDLVLWVDLTCWRVAFLCLGEFGGLVVLLVLRVVLIVRILRWLGVLG